MSINISFLDSSTVGDDLDLSLFEELGNLKVYRATDDTNFEEHASGSDVLILNKVKLNERNLCLCPNLKLICVTATGYDNIDIEYCRQRGIAVCNVVGYSTQNVAQITVAMVLSLISHLREYNSSVAGGEYSNGKTANILKPVYNEIYGKTWGIIGYGNIGKQVGRVAEALGCKVIYNKRTSDGASVTIDEICQKADIISVHTPLTSETRGMINRERINSMKPTAILVNVARGAVTDENALADAILENRIGGLGVDVYSIEPFGRDHPFTKIKGLDNVILTPHMAWGSYEARVRCCDEVALNIKAFLSGEKRCRVV